MPTAVRAWGRVVLLGPTRAELATWAIGGTGSPDLAVVDALGRWQLAARRSGGAIVLRDVCDELAELLELAGLCGEVGGEAEPGEQLLGVEEGVEPADPVA
jgi:hypothetical protein